MTAVAVADFIFGGIGVFANLWAIMVCFAFLSHSFVLGRAAQILVLNLGYALYGLVCGGLLIGAGVGVLNVARWGRTLSLVYVGLSVFGSVAYLFVPALDGSGRDNVGFLIGKIVGSLLRLTYPVILLVVFHKPRWKQAFR